MAFFSLFLILRCTIREKREYNKETEGELSETEVTIIINNTEKFRRMRKICSRIDWERYQFCNFSCHLNLKTI